MKPYLESGGRLTVEIKREVKTRDQEKLYHKLVSQISTRAQHMGSTWDSESWKRLLVDAYATEVGISRGRVIPNLNGDGVIQLGIQTRKFSKEEATGFVEWLYAWCAQNGVDVDSKD
jgi:hypothetical protein